MDCSTRCQFTAGFSPSERSATAFGHRAGVRPSSTPKRMSGAGPPTTEVAGQVRRKCPAPPRSIPSRMQHIQAERRPHTPGVSTLAPTVYRLLSLDTGNCASLSLLRAHVICTYSTSSCKCWLSLLQTQADTAHYARMLIQLPRVP